MIVLYKNKHYISKHFIKPIYVLNMKGNFLLNKTIKYLTGENLRKHKKQPTLLNYSTKSIFKNHYKFIIFLMDYEKLLET